MNMKISSKQLKAAALCQGKGDIRHYLNGIHIYEDKIEATNGHIAVQMTMSKKIKRDLILNITGIIPKKAQDSVFVFGDDNFVKNYDKYGALISVLVVDVIDGKFPDLNRVMPKGFKEVSHIGVETSYLHLFGKMFDCRYGGIAKLQFTGENGSMLLTSVNSHINDEYGNPKFIVMPARVD
jgi:DNA polymerase III sliding clamp (beta) subunit (PCNA family)